MASRGLADAFSRTPLKASDARENGRVHGLGIPGAVQLAKWSGVSASTATWLAVRVTGLGGWKDVGG